MAGKTNAERQKVFREQRRKMGLKEIRSLYSHPDDIQLIRDYAQWLTNKRMVKT